MVYARVRHVEGVRFTRRFTLELDEEACQTVENIEGVYVYRFSYERGTASASRLAIVAVGGVQDAPATAREGESDGGEGAHEDDHTPLTLRDKLVAVREAMTEAFSLPDAARKQAFRRLYLMWHPDKNPEDIVDATEAFKFLKSMIDAGHVLSIPGEEDEASEQQRGGGSGASGFGHGGGETGGYQESYPEWDRWQQASSQAHRRRNPHPDPTQANRWAEQAEENAETMRCLFEAGRNAHTCFFAHQVAECALKMALYAVGTHDAHMLTHHKLGQFADTLAESRPEEVADIRPDIQQLGRYYLRTRYPNCVPSHETTTTLHSKRMAEEAMLAADTVLSTLRTE